MGQMNRLRCLFLACASIASMPGTAQTQAAPQPNQGPSIDPMKARQGEELNGLSTLRKTESSIADLKYKTGSGGATKQKQPNLGKRAAGMAPMNLGVKKSATSETLGASTSADRSRAGVANAIKQTESNPSGMDAPSPPPPPPPPTQGPKQ